MPDTVKLLNAIDAAEAQAYGSEMESELSSARASAIDMYLGKNTDPAPDGRSQVISRDVYDTIEIIKPSLLRIFAGGDEVVQFEPIGPDDEAQADQEAAYLNYQVTQRNPWFQVCNDWFTDALLTKNAYCLASWDKRIEVETETYEGQSDDQMALLMQDGVQVVAHDARPDETLAQMLGMQYQQQVEQYQQMAAQATGQPIPPPPQQPPMPMLHDLKVKRIKPSEKLCLSVLPPERCKIGQDTPNFLLREANYFEFWEMQTISELRSMGFEVPDDVSGDHNETDTSEDSSRDQFGEGEQFRHRNDSVDPAMRRVKTRMIWIRHDYDEDGIAELQYVLRVGNTILYRDDVSRIPVASIVSNPLPHRHPGLSVADVTSDIQAIKTAILRQGLDNLYLANNARMFASDKINLDDLLVSRPGGLIRGRAGAVYGQDIAPVQTPFVFPQAIAGLEYMDQVRENRTGTNRYFTGTDEQAVNKTASGIAQLTSAAAQRVEMIGRVFALGMEELFAICHELILKHQRKADTIKLRGKWTVVDPSTWRHRKDVKISVGLGTGNREQLLANLTRIAQMQMGALPLGIATPTNVYQSHLEIAKAAGFPSPQKFFTDPATLPPPQPPPPDPIVQVETIKQQAETQRAGQQLQLDSQKALADAELTKYKIDKDAEVKIAIEQMQYEGKVRLEAYKAELDYKSDALKAVNETRGD